MLIDGAGVQIATKDWGGGDIPLLLTHGAGHDKRSLSLLVPLLTPTFRVVTFDLRNHGQSTEGPWEWPLVTADVEAVRVAYDMDAPVVAGHSLGGMVAAIYAADYPATRAAINIDGQGRGKPSNYLGLTEAEVAEAWAALEEIEANVLKDLGPRFVEMIDVLNGLDMFEVWRATPCPLLLFNCVAHDPMYAGEGMQRFGETMAAYRAGLARDFAALAEEVPSIEIATLEKTHISVITEPAEAAERITEFIGRH